MDEQNTLETIRMDAAKANQIKDIDNRFTYHPPISNQTERYLAVRAKAKELAMLIASSSEMSREQSLALTKLQECVMWTNASIAINEVDHAR